MKMLRFMVALSILGVSARIAGASPTWTSPGQVETLLTDDCGGTSVTSVYLVGDSNPYYFLNSSGSAKFWASQIELAVSTGANIKIKYESTSSNPGAGCGFNPGYVVYVLAVEP
jgi:hypothetical protein